MSKFIPVNEALKFLKLKGHEVAKVKSIRAAGFGGPSYLIDGKECSLYCVRTMAANLGYEAKQTKTVTEKPRREIETIAEAVAEDQYCKSKRISVCTVGERRLNGQIVYGVIFYQDGQLKHERKTLSWIRDWAKLMKLI